uniref:Protein TIC 214 n=1 Tax=Anathallis microphyta TaxID=2767037 RepID=A0A8F9WFU7_9ASPA|nr:hypothetical protein Ycf1 [Anathallis microphyta]
MIFKSFLLGNPLSLCMKIINSVVVVGLYYGFMTTFSIGPSYLFLLRARVMEEGAEKEVSATTGFIAGQLMMFISIYYAPLHLALGRPHTITILVLPYLLFHFFWNNNKNFFDYGSTTRNSMRNLSIQCVFLNNLIFQLFNHFILPSSTLARLVNIYMFRCNNNILFLTSSFVGWLIGHILFMKWFGLVLFWIRQNHSIRSNKYLVSELRNYMARIFSILLFITCVYYLGRMPSPIVTKKMKDKETSETEEGGERKEESDVETTYEMKETQQEQEGFTEEKPSLCSEEKEDLDKIDETEEIQMNGKEKTKDEFHFQDQDSPVYEDYDLENHQENWELGRLKEEKNTRINKKFAKTVVTFLFNYKRWNRPLRYIKNDKLENALRNEMSQFFFFPCTNNGKQIISFTYLPSLSTFSEMLERIISLYIIEKLYDEDLYNSWISTNEKKKCNLNNELRSRINIIETNERSPSLDMLEKRILLCDDEKKKKCLPKAYDPFFNGSYRGTRKKLDLRAIMNTYTDTDTEDLVEFFFINKIHDLLLNDSVKLHRQSFFHCTEEKVIDSESQAKYLQFVFDVITTHKKDRKTMKNKSIRIRRKEISKKVSKWSYKLNQNLGELGEEEEGNEEEFEEESYGIHSRRFQNVILYEENDQNTKSLYSIKDIDIDNICNNAKNDDQMDEGEEGEVILRKYSEQSDFRRNLIKGSMRAQRRKTVIWGLFQLNVHSPLFVDRLDKPSFFSFFDINEMKNLFFRNWMGREQESEFKISYFENEDTKEEKKYKNEQTEISQVWDTFLFLHILRSLLLVTQSFLRKYIILPLLIITKNIFRILLFQITEWDEDFKEWNREMHIPCTYNGVELTEAELNQDWLSNVIKILIDGIQIKIKYPFCLKPWRKPKAQSHHRDLMKKKDKKQKFFFLTVWGKEANFPFGPPRKRPFFFKPFFKELQNRKKKVKNRFLQVFKSLKKIKSFRKDETKGVIKIINLIMENLNNKFELRQEKEYEPKENKKDFKRNNKIIRESSVLNRTLNWFNYSLIERIERRMKDLSDKTIQIRNQIERTAKGKKKKEIVLIYDKKFSGSQKHIWKIVKSKNIRLMRKSHYFIKSFIEKIYINIFLCTITIYKINAQLLFESRKKIFKKSIDNNEPNKNRMNFLLTIKKLFSNTNNSKKNSNTYWNLSSLSQAYVFYKISQNQLLNKSNLRPLLKYQGSHPFFKANLKDSCMIHGIFHSKSRHKKTHTYIMNEWKKMNEWKNWLKGHYQYDLSQKKKSRLMPKEWQNRINKHRMIQNKESNQLDLDKKYQLIYSMNKNIHAANSFMSQKDKWKKHYRYDLLSSKYISLPNLDIYGSTLEKKGDQEIPYHFNTSKPESFDVLVSIPNNDSIEKGYPIERNKNLDRKYFDCRILHLSLCFIKNIEILTNAHIGIKIQKKTKNEIKNLKKMKKKDFLSPTIYQEIKPFNQKDLFFDCMGMNKERFYDTASNHDIIPNLETWFFPEFVLLFDEYKKKPWIIPIKSLFFQFSISEKSKNINVNPKKSSKKKKDKKTVEEDYGIFILERKKDIRKKKGYKKRTI